MNKNYTALFSILCLSLFISNLQAQRTCNHAAHTQSLMQNHEYAVEHQKRQVQFDIVYQQNTSSARAQCSNPVTLPVAVHYQNLNPGYNEACLITLAESQIQILNEDYGGHNADIST